MSEHPDLVGLLRGELGNAEAVAAGLHVEVCEECRAELVDTVVGHALLTRAGVTLGAQAVPGELPDVPEPRPLELPARRRRTTALLAAAAAAVLVAGVGGVAWWEQRGDEAAPAGVTASLTPLSGDEPGDGSVRMVEHDGRTRMTLAVHDLPDATDGEFYYAWLLDPATDKMLALGLVDPRRDATFDLDDALVSSYSAVDVSLEADDGDPAHSVTSVLRGSYEPDQITTAEGNR